MTSRRRSTERQGEGFTHGLSRITPRYDYAKGVIAGYQLTCGCPRHVGCNRTLSNAVSGSDEMTLRTLKFWANMWFKADDKKAHKKLWGEQVEPAWKAGRLPTDIELERSKPVSWTIPATVAAVSSGATSSAVLASSAASSADVGNGAAICAAVVVPSESEDESRSAKRRRLADDALLAAAPRTPPAVQGRMEELIKSGAIPATSKLQRARNLKQTPGTGYRMPPIFTEAFTYRYVHPNLEPPGGYRWKKMGPYLSLLPKGG